jgi:uroporphyrin-III C-methyltransferase
MKKITPKLTLVGAGPGDAELITVKGLKAIQNAEAIIYDALVSTDLLAHAPAHTPKIFVGKKTGENYTHQSEINELIIDHILTYGHVVHLKGGDPFVFGRGFEEIEYMESFGIETEVVPGISSALGVPSLLGIPMTHQGNSESFWVLTGNSKDDQLSSDIALAAKSTATLVILMAMHRLEQIVSTFQRVGKQDAPIAIIQNGSLPDEKIVAGNINTILKIAKDAQISSPAIIVIGETVQKCLNLYLKISQPTEQNSTSIYG